MRDTVPRKKRPGQKNAQRDAKKNAVLKNAILARRRWAVTAAAMTFAVSAGLSLVAGGASERLNIGWAAAILFIFIVLGIMFDILGIAVASASEAPFHSMNARKVKGAKYAVMLIRHADKVSSVCNDVVGDILNIISGSMCAVIVAYLVSVTGFNPIAASVLTTALIASATVGGKALGKSFALKQSTGIVFFAGKLMSLPAAIFDRKKSPPSADGNAADDVKANKKYSKDGSAVGRDKSRKPH